MSTARAAFLTAPSTIEIRDVPLPDDLGDGALLRVEACGLCGSDVEQFHGGTREAGKVVVPGHEPLGVIDRISPAAAERWGVAVGDRVVPEIVVPCGACRRCDAGETTSCERSLGSYGYRPFPSPTELVGGFADYMYLHPNTVVHRMNPDIPAELAAMFNPIAAGIRWGVQLGGAGTGDTVLVLGAGQRGIAAAMAVKSAGAARVIMTGLASDAHKLALARDFGVDDTIVVDDDVDVPERVRALTDGAMADVVLELTPMAAQPVRDAIDAARVGGTVVLAGLKGHRPIELVTDRIIQKGLRLVGALGVDSTSVREAIRLVESGVYPLERLHTHTYGVDEVGTALRVLAGEVAGEEPVHVAVVPA